MARQRTDRRRIRPEMTALESREVPATLTGLGTGDLVYNAAAGVANNLLVEKLGPNLFKFTDPSEGFSLTALVPFGLKSLTVNLGDMDDQVRVGSNVTPSLFMSIKGSSGNDRVELPVSAAVGMLGVVSVDGGTGTGDRIVVTDDLAQAASHKAVMTTDAIDHDAASPIKFANMDGVEYNGSAWNDIVRIVGTTAGVSTTVRGRDGNDLLLPGTDAANNYTMNQIQGTIWYEAGLGDDRLNYDDQGNAFSENYVVQANAIDSDSTAPVFHSGVESIDFLTTYNFGAVVQVNSLASTHKMYIYLGDSFNRVTVGSASGGVSNFTGELFVYGKSTGYDVVTYDDRATVADRNLGAWASIINGLWSENVSGGSTGVVHTFEADFVRIFAGQGDDVINLSGILADLNMEVDGGVGSDTLTGANVANTFTVTGPDSGTMTVLGTSDFKKIENLRGVNPAAGAPDTGVDTFVFKPGGSISGSIDGFGGIDTIDYSALTTDVYANLTTGQATGVAGTVTGVENLKGGSGNDILVGNAASNAIDGGLGNDLLIGGLGADALTGGGDQDILIGGSTVHDGNATNLKKIRDIWTLPDTYSNRVTYLVNGQPGNPPLLGAGSLINDFAIDSMLGQSGTDLFFASLDDTTDWNFWFFEQVKTV